MPEAADAQGMLRQNLADAGCGRELAERCMELARNRRTGEMWQALAGHRRVLPDALHQDQKRIDSLDYLIRQLKKRKQGVI